MTEKQPHRILRNSVRSYGMLKNRLDRRSREQLVFTVDSRVGRANVAVPFGQAARGRGRRAGYCGNAQA